MTNESKEPCDICGEHDVSPLTPERLETLSKLSENVHCFDESKEQWWMKEWEERFAENYVYWQEIRQEALVGDPDLKSLVAFIQKTVTEAFSRGVAQGKVEGLEDAIKIIQHLPDLPTGISKDTVIQIINLSIEFLKSKNQKNNYAR